MLNDLKLINQFILKQSMAASRFALLLVSLVVVTLSEATRPSLFSSTSDDAQNSTTWAVLVAGSSSYYNYRHQVRIVGICRTPFEFFPKKSVWRERERECSSSIYIGLCLVDVRLPQAPLNKSSP